MFGLMSRKKHDAEVSSMVNEIGILRRQLSMANAELMDFREKRAKANANLVPGAKRKAEKEGV